MSNIKKMEKAIKDLLEIMISQEDDVNILVMKTMIQQYSDQSNIPSLQLSKDLFDEFLNNKIEDKFHKKVEKEEKVKNEELYINTQEAYHDYFKQWYLSGRKENNETDYIFYRNINKTIWKAFIESHRLNLPHRYAPKQIII
jgi:hypothetical protein